MSLPAAIPQAIRDTILGRIAPLFLTAANGDAAVAHDAASHMLADYNTETEEEFSLAAEIVSFRLHTLEALSLATDPDMSLNKVLRLRGGAVGLSREAHKSQRKLDQLQRARRAGPRAVVQPEAPAPQFEPVPDQSAPDQPKIDQPKIDEAVGLINFARQTIDAAKKNGGLTWTQSYQQRQTAKRLAKRLIKKQLIQVRPAADTTQTAQVSG